MQAIDLGSKVMSSEMNAGELDPSKFGSFSSKMNAGQLDHSGLGEADQYRFRSLDPSRFGSWSLNTASPVCYRNFLAEKAEEQQK